jgi:predicted XRE-type DNA-binding protein
VINNYLNKKRWLKEVSKKVKEAKLKSAEGITMPEILSGSINTLIDKKCQNYHQAK